MRTENINVKITIPIPINKRDNNGFIYTKEAIETAINNLHKNLPIIYRDNINVDKEKVIGTTTGNSHIVNWDFENNVCEVTIDGNIYYGGTEYIVNKVKDNVITNFEITSIGLSK